MEYLSPKLDIVFKTMFGNSNNIAMLKDLLKTYLGVEDKGNYVLSNTEITPEELDRKFARLDLRITTKETEMNVEVQVINQSDYRERSIYYWASLYASAVKRGNKYGVAKSTYTLNILDFTMFDECDNFETNFTFYDRENDIALSDKVGISYLELPKIKEYTPEQLKTDSKIAWAAFFNAKSEEEFNMVTQSVTNPNVQQAVAIIKELSADERLREQARRREDALRDERFALTAERNAERAAMIQAMRSAGMSEGDIQRIVRASAQYRNQQPQALDEDASDEEDEEMDFEP